jgi:hypothetical protein
LRHFSGSIIFASICLGLATWWGYEHGGTEAALTGFGIALILGVLEVSLSFDNAVVNASVLKHWNEFWQKLFLTAGILVAVVGMRLLFPLVIVAQTADLGATEVWNLAMHDPRQFSYYLTKHHDEVAAFGGVFLLLVFLNFLFDENKELHWAGHFEEKIASYGKIQAVPIFIALSVVLSSLALAEPDNHLPVLTAGVWGIIIYVGVDILGNMLEKEESGENDVAKAVKTGSIGGFLYLEVLDASFSFDGVIGAFAITNDVVIIMLGLAIGAVFVRSLTVYLVKQGTLDEYVYLEHGAHYAIGILALIMFITMKFHVPEIITGMIGIAFIVASVISSLRYRRQQEAAGES